MRGYRKLRYTVYAIVLTLCLPAELALALALEEVVVTARKRDETLQNVPVSVSAISGDAFEKAGLVDMKDVAQLTPNFYADTVVTGQRVSLRGLGNSVVGPGFDSSVGLSLDGLYFGRPRWLEVGMFDLQQLEVLRGPQGIYFGKNTTSGLINLKSRGPSEEWEGYVKAAYETQLEKNQYEAAISGPLTENFGMRLAIQHIEEDGWIKNLDVGGLDPGKEQDMARLSLEFTPTDTLTITSKTNYANSEVAGLTEQIYDCGSGSGSLLDVQPFLNNMAEDCDRDGSRTGGRTRTAFDREMAELMASGVMVLDANNGFAPYQPRQGQIDGNNDFYSNESFSQSLTVSWEVGDYSFESTTGYSDQKVRSRIDADFFDVATSTLPAPFPQPNVVVFFGPLLGFQIDEDYEQYSQEFRMQSSIGDSVDYVVGVYYEENELNVTDLTDFSIDLFQLFASRDKQADIKGESWAIFGEVTFDISDTFRVMLGGRYTEEKKDGSAAAEIGSFGNPYDDDVAALGQLGGFGITEVDVSGSRKVEHFSPSFVAQWDAFNDAVVYFSYKEGFKSGGYDTNVSGPSSEPFYEFDDEEVMSYELGAKWELDQLRMSAALFHSEYDNLQVSIFDGTASIFTRNAATAVSQGFELEGLWAATDELTVNFGLGYTNATYDKFDDAPCYRQQTAGCLPPKVPGGSTRQDLSDARLALAPEWTGNIGASWEREVTSGLMLELNMDASYRDEVWTAVDHNPDYEENDLWLINARVALSDVEGRWTAALIGRNLADEEYSLSYSDVPFFNADRVILGSPATYEFQFTYRFF